jgi:hypothetical protein
MDMVSRPITMNQTTGTSSDGERGARSKRGSSGDYDDALVLATAMASGGSTEEQERSPSGGTHSQPKQGEDEEDANDRDDSSSTDHHPYLDQPQFPPSPMVTPPSRSCNAAAGEAVFRSASASSLKKHPQQQTVAGVPHVYHDYSVLPDDSSYIRKKTGGVTQPFPEKLHEMLQSVDGTDAMDIVAWLPHGRAFLVRKPKGFTDTIMPKYVFGWRYRVFRLALWLDR